MWFKNLVLFRLGRRSLPWEEFPLANLLDVVFPPFDKFTPCGPMDAVSRGFVSPCGDDRLIYKQGPHMLLSLCTETKILPPAVINRAAAEKIKAIEEAEGHPVGRKQRCQIKEEARATLLPKAFTRRTYSHIWVDTANGWAGIDTPSSASADDAVRILPLSLEAQEAQLKALITPEPGKELKPYPLAINLPRTKLSPQAAMTDWLISGEPPAGFTVDRDCELRHPLEEKPTVRYTHHPLDGEEIRKHLVAGKLPTRLALTWKDRISFVLTDRLEIKRLAFLDILKEEAETNASNAAEQFDADFALMTGELSRFIPDLVAALGGEAEVG